ncbi:STAS domain-containing protein [Kutzneria sp. CA-103260]|uniref:STAS domain-containing protein n=1 Tax=Kutzneria sp. CA-103260 TaxID=2802641 RepID=UPI001BA8D07D|nr:STAS domain-containing protein [Kutzneria sp. CA-103260]QUQ62890.1 STAS domain protein [Kutzneria sp. CA-103260]
MTEAGTQAATLTLALAGELDVGTQATTSALIEKALNAAPRVLVLDLREVDFLGSTGLSVLIEAQRTAEARNTLICLVTNRRATLLPLELTGLTTMFPMFKTPEEAKRSAHVQREQARVVPRVGTDVRQ